MPVNSSITSVEDGNVTPKGESLPINELFYSLQGEGSLAGTPSVFIRTSGCNLRCWYCDSYHTSWEPTHARLNIDEIIEEVSQYEQPDHVVLTGGEPMMHERSVELLSRLDEVGFHTTVETNGTIFRDAPIDLASISPKLENSTPTANRDPKGEGEWAARHDENRINLESMAQLIETYDFQLKFVVTDTNDIHEISDIVNRLRETSRVDIQDSDVLLMPEGTTSEELNNTRETAATLAMESGFRYSPRLHVNLWEDAPGR